MIEEINIPHFKQLFQSLLQNIKKTKEMNTDLFTEISTNAFIIEELNERMEKNIENNKQIFVFNSKKSSTEEFNIQNIISTFSKIITKKHKTESDNKIFFNRLNQEMRTIINITDLFDELNRIADDMKLLSLNAHILSYNLGGKGKTLMKITNEISNISYDITGYVKKIEQLTLGIMNFSNDVNFIINKIADFSNDILKTSEENSDILRNILNSFSENFNTIFNSILENTAEISQIQENFMQQIQNEDILRQKIEHSEQICEEVLNIIDNSTEQLDSSELIYLFIEAISILENISHNSFDKYNDFIKESKNSLKILNETLTEILKKNRSMTSSDIENDSDKFKIQQQVNIWENEITKRSNIMLKGKNKILSDWKNNNNYSSQITTNIIGFNKIKQKLNLLAVLSNIQVKKNKLISEDYKFARRLKNISNTVGTSVEKGFSELSEHLSKLQLIMDRFKDSYDKDSCNFETLIDELKTIEEQFQIKAEIFSKEVQNFEQIVISNQDKLSDFTDTIEKNENELEQLKENFDEFVNSINIEIKSTKNIHNVDIEKSPQSKYLKDVVENFNIHFDKIKAYQDNTTEQIKENTTEQIKENTHAEELEDDDNFTLF